VSQLPVPSNLGQLHNSSSEGAGSAIGSGREQSGVEYRWLDRPPDDDHCRGFVGFDQFDGDRAGSR
jgi:hypothetical protein